MEKYLHLLVLYVSLFVCFHMHMFDGFLFMIFFLTYLTQKQIGLRVTVFNGFLVSFISACLTRLELYAHHTALLNQMQSPKK